MVHSPHVLSSLYHTAFEHTLFSLLQGEGLLKLSPTSVDSLSEVFLAINKRSPWRETRIPLGC